MLRRINCITSCIRKQQNLMVNRVWLCTAANLSVANVHLEQQLSSEQEAQILKIVNENTMIELNRYDIKRVAVKKLVSHRKKNGILKSLQELREIEGMDADIFQKFCLSILEGKKKTVASKAKGTSLVTPSISAKQKETRTTLGIHIGPDVVSWALLNHTYNLLEWNCEPVPKTLYDTSIINSLGIAFEIVRKIPVSDLYVYHDETKEKRSRSPARMVMAQDQLAVALVTYLAFRSGRFPDLLSTDNLFAINHKALARSYGLIVGHEIVSTQHIVDKLHGNTDPSDRNEKNLPRVNIADDLMNAYKRQPSQYKEQMNWALLKALAFVHQGIHDNPM